MNKLFTTFLIIISAISINIYAQSVWQWQQPQPTGNFMWSVDFVDENTGYAAGDVGTVMKTTNGGMNWETKTVNPDLKILGMCFYDSDLGFVSGTNNGSVYRTTNGGENWSLVLTAGVIAMWEINFPTRNTGYVVGLNGVIYKTTNSGLNWTQQSSLTSANLFTVDFIDSLNGVMGGSRFLAKTTNGGINWVNQNLNFFSLTAIVTSADFIDSNNIICLAQGDSQFFKTTDGGSNWNALPLLFLDFDLERTISFINPDTGIMATDYGRILRTTNGGVFWNIDTTFKPRSYEIGVLFDTYFLDNSTAFVSGSGGRIIKSTNNGVNWFTSTGGRYNYNSNYFIDQNTGFSVGDEGKILKTTNAGVKWVEKQSNTVQNLNSVYIVNNNNGYICGDTGLILKSTDGGENWQVLNSTVIQNLRDIYFYNSERGLVVGKNGTLLKTENGGVNWFNYITGTSSELKSISFPDTITGYIVSQTRTLKSIDGGYNWFSILNGGGDDVMFADSLNGFTVSGSGTILKTTNGSVNWVTQNANVLGNLNSICILNENNGFVVGTDGSISRTTNSGTNWIPQAKLTDNNLNSVIFTDSENGYITGDFGTLIKTTNGGLTFITKINDLQPNDFTLFQNYPNPFNSSTVIKYNLKASGFIEIKVYDLVGRKLFTLVNESQNSGSFSVLFSSDEINSGVYFYSLFINNIKKITKKFLLIK